MLPHSRFQRRFKLRDLDILTALADTGTMGKAAKSLGLSQPAISKAMSDLEGSLGVQLIERSRQGVELTEYGRVMTRRGVAIFDELQQGLKEMDFLADPTAGEVRIGATEAVAAALVGPVIDRLSRLYPRMKFPVFTGETARLLDELDARSVDLIMHRWSRTPSDQHHAEVLFYDQPILVTGIKNPLGRRRGATLTDFANEPWVLLPMDAPSGAFQREVFRDYGMEPPHATVETMSYSLRHQLLATHRFVTVTTSFTVLFPAPRPELRIIALKMRGIGNPVGVVTLKNRVPSPTVRMFIDAAREYIRPLAGRVKK